MPYYRIVIWTNIRKAPYSGIRLHHDDNINAVYNHYHSESVRKYGKDFVDCEVQMLSKLCKAIQDYIKSTKHE